MASTNQLVMSEVKIEIDVAEEPGPGPPWGSQQHCSDTTGDWSENSVNSTIPPCETDCWNPSAAAMKCEPDSQPASGQGIKAEPVDHSVTSVTDSTSLHMSANPNRSLLRLNRSHVCPRCSASFVLFSFLKQHMASVHGEKLQAVFPVSSTSEGGGDGDCGHVDFQMNIDNLGGRKTVERKKDKVGGNEADRTDLEKDSMLYVCDVCSTSFSQASDLKKHKLIHTGQKQFVCDVCSKSFTEAGSLKRHKLSHTGHKQFECGVCSKTFTLIGDLKRHKLIHTDHRQFVCDLCSKAFTRADHLKKHKLIHTGEKEFECDVCSMAFTHSGNLNVHRLIHSGRKQFACDMCSKAFTQAGTLKTHRRTHTGERPYVCTDCGESFAYSNILKKHILTHI